MNMQKINNQLSVAFAVATAAAVLTLAGCSIIKTTASVAGSVASTTTDVAKATVTTGAVVGSGAVAAASAAKAVTLATASVAISGASLVGSVVMWGISMKQSDEFAHAMVVSEGGGRFLSAEGKLLETEGCAETAPKVPGTLFVRKSGGAEVRVNGAACAVAFVR